MGENREFQFIVVGHTTAIASSPDQSDFQYLTDSHTQSVFLDFKTHLELWQMIYDRVIA